MFKVGDMVWHKELECFVYIHSVEEDYYIFKHEDDEEAFLVANNNLHQTAHDMFEALGYVKETDDENLILYWKELPYQEIHFDRSDNTIGILESDWLTKKTHQAIHQQLIELGWLE